MIVPEYTAGDWTAVVRPGFVALLGPDVPAATARAVWDSADRGVLGVLAVLSHDGLGSLPPFAIAVARGRRVHVALRGEVEVVADEQVLASGEVSTWTERVLDDVAAVIVRAAGGGEGVELPLTEGVVRASGVRVRLAASDDEPGPVEVPEVAVAAEEPVAGRAVGQIRVAKVVDEQSAPAADEVVDEPVAEEPFVEPAGAEEPVAFEEAAVDDMDDEPATPDESDVVAAVEAFLAGAQVAAPVGPVELEGASAEDHDGMTILSSDLVAIRDRLPAWAADDAPATFHAPAPVAAPARIALSTGLVVDLDRAVLVGRAPQVSRVANRELPRLVTVPSPQQDISRTHAEVRTEGDLVLVTDLDSTNGVHVSRPGEGARRLHPGEPTVVEPGEVVDLGDGVTFVVERGA
jgi:hypothetical protein